jgi:hypothetical protein
MRMECLLQGWEVGPINRGPFRLREVVLNIEFRHVIEGKPEVASGVNANRTRH